MINLFYSSKWFTYSEQSLIMSNSLLEQSLNLALSHSHVCDCLKFSLCRICKSEYWFSIFWRSLSSLSLSDFCNSNSISFLFVLKFYIWKLTSLSTSEPLAQRQLSFSKKSFVSPTDAISAKFWFCNWLSKSFDSANKSLLSEISCCLKSVSS